MYTIYDEEDGKYQLVEEPDHSLTYTYADYYKWKFEERLELLRGKIFKLAAPSFAHVQATLSISAKLYNYLKGSSCMAFMAPCDVRLPVKNRKKDNEIATVVQPDAGVVCDPSKIDVRGICGAPDLVVEVLSPGNSRRDLKDKYEIYEEAGVIEYWIVDIDHRNVMAFCLDLKGKFNSAKIYVDGDRLESTSVSGFSIDITDLFTQ